MFRVSKKSEKDMGYEKLIVTLFSHLSRFYTWRICSREQGKKQLDWLATNTDVITGQSYSLFSLFARTNSPSGKPALVVFNNKLNLSSSDRPVSNSIDSSYPGITAITMTTSDVNLDY